MFQQLWNAKRAYLSEGNFENLVFLKGNLQLLKENFNMPKAVFEPLRRNSVIIKEYNIKSGSLSPLAF